MKIGRTAVLPNLITIGNGICGFAAMVKILKVDVIDGRFENDQFFLTAAWLILLGMVFDVFDGRVARITGKTSELGAQLDSLCDLVTFGLAPALLVVRLNMIHFSTGWGYWVWLCCLLYFMGATLRLARFNCENEPDDSAHLCFKGLPTPAAAGCLATLVIFYFYVMRFESKELQLLAPLEARLQAGVQWLPILLPVLAMILGYTMISNRLKFDHIASRLFHRHHSFDFMAYLIFGGILIATLPEVLLPLLFLGYLCFTPVRYVWGVLFRGHREAPVISSDNGRDGPEPAVGDSSAFQRPAPSERDW